MKKILILGLIFTLLVNTILITSAENSYLNSSSMSETLPEDNVLYISDSDINESTNFNELEYYISTGGIIVVIHEKATAKSVQIGEQLGMLLSIVQETTDDDSQISERGNYVDPGVDVATLYYEYGNGLKGTYHINVGTNNIDSANTVITSVIEVIRDRQSCNDTVTEMMVVNDETVYAEPLDILDTITYRAPKGTIEDSYHLYSIEDYFGEDFYIVKMKSDGNPGCVLAKRDDEFESKYQGEWFYTSIGSPTTSVAVDDAGPDTTSYTVDIGGSFEKNNVCGVSGGFSWTETINNVDIVANEYSDLAEWDVDLSFGAHKSTFEFEPAAIFDCPTGKASVDLEVYAAYTIDALTSVAEDIEISEIIECTISSAEFQ